MNSLLSLWSALDARRRVIVIGATLAMFAAILGLSRMATTQDMALLFSGLGPTQAGEVVAALDQQAVAYEVRGEAIYVPSAQRDSLRMALAGQGLPANAGAGYELLDEMSGFGTTSQMFDAAYWRAKEGELARTILANPQVRAARVHIARAPQQPFQPDNKATASVQVTTGSGTLTPGQAQAIRHLVAAAVTGMQAADVEVIDSIGGLIPVEGDQTPSRLGASRAEDLRQNVERLLAARVGPGKAVVEVSVDVVSETEQITERKFDPQGRVAISTETEAKSGSDTANSGGVTVASNLPEGDAAAGAPGSSNSEESRERVNYEVSETQREVLRAPGDIRRLSIAVLVDGQQITAEDGTVTWEPRTEEELSTLRELVASAVGLNEERGDVLTLKSLEFRAMPDQGTLAEAGMLSLTGPINVMSLVQLGLLATVALMLGLFVVRPVLASANVRALPAPDMPLSLGSDEASNALTGEIDDGAFEMPMMPMMDFDLPGMGGGMGSAGPVDPNDPVARLRRLIQERQAESVEILRGWMEVEEEKT